MPGQVATNTFKLAAVGLRVFVVEGVFFKPDDLDTKPVINLLDALLEGGSSLRTKTFAAFSTSPVDPTFSGLPPLADKGCGGRPSDQPPDFRDVKEIVFGSHFTERHDFNAVGLSVQCIEKQVFEITQSL